jgi:Mg2+/Co2+ transporter CorB
MSLKSILSKNNLVNLIDPIIYVINIIIIVVIIIFINKNVYHTMVIQGEELRSKIDEAPNDINLKEFNEVIDRINSRKNKLQSITVGEIF